jgi:argininosuccinate lyase
MPFRDAYKITGSIVMMAEKSGVDLSEMSIEELKSVDSRIEEDVLTFLNLRNSMNARDSYGGTATEETVNQLRYYIEWIKGIS